jgi:DNA-binding NarL/FixJ family response regulator
MRRAACQHKSGADATADKGTPVRVLAVDDHDAFLAALREIIEATEGFELVGVAGTGEDAVAAASELRPDLVIMDKRMPGLDGIEACALLTERHPDVRVILISVEEPGDGRKARAARAAAIIRKEDLSRARLRQLWQDS